MLAFSIRFHSLADMANFLNKADVCVLDYDANERTLQAYFSPAALTLAKQRFGVVVLDQKETEHRGNRDYSFKRENQSSLG